MSLFDTPKPFLNPDVWEGGLLKPEVKAYILELLGKIFPVDKVQALVMIGSMVGHQYSETSDIDINLMARKGELFDKWHPIFKHYNSVEHPLPGTKHPINFFFQEYNHESDWSNSLGAYDIFMDLWIKRAPTFEEIGNPEEKYEREIAWANMIISLVDSEVERAEKASQRGDRKGATDIYKGLARLFDTVEENRKTAYRYQTGTPALQEYNILYKLLEKSRHRDLFKALVDYYDQHVGAF